MPINTLIQSRLCQTLRTRHTAFKPLDIKAWHHQGSQGPIVQMKHISHHLMFMFFDQPSIHTLFQAGCDFLFSHGTIATRINAQQFQNSMGCDGQQTDKRPGRTGQPSHWSRNKSCHGLWIKLANSFWHKFTKNNGCEGNGGHNQ